MTELQLIKEIRAPLPYNLLSQLESYMAREGFELAARDFGEHVVLTLRVPSDREADFDFAASTLGGMKQESEVWPLTKRVNRVGETGTF